MIHEQDTLDAALKTYKYQAPPLSLFERLWLKAWWDKCPELFYPMWLAPNLITFTGLCCIYTSFYAQCYYTTDLTTGLPSWWYLFASVCSFLYQVLPPPTPLKKEHRHFVSSFHHFIGHRCIL